MKIIDQLRKRITNLLGAPLDELGQWARFLRFQIHLWRFCARRLNKNNALAMSSALSFRTIFAIIPALVLAIVILKPFGLVQTTKAGIEQALKAAALDQIVITEETGTSPGRPDLPDTERPPSVVTLAETIERLVSRVERKLTFGRIGPIGVLVLIWAVLTLLTTMERSLNRVFGARRVRGLGKRVLLYWSVVTLCPLLLVTAVYLGGLAAETVQEIPVVSWILSAVGWTAPVLVGIALLATIYKLMPNTQVGFRAALGGAAVAAPLWLIAKWGFALYITRLVGRGSLYGTLGLLPLFLFWMNLSWLLFLFGATIAHTAANLREMQAAEESEKFVPTASSMVAATVAVAKPFLAGAGPVGLTEVAGELRLSHEAAEWLLERLGGMGIVSRVESADRHSYVLARPAGKIPMTELLEIDEDEGAASDSSLYAPEIAGTVRAFRDHTREALGKLTLENLIGEQKSSTD